MFVTVSEYHVCFCERTGTMFGTVSEQAPSAQTGRCCLKSYVCPHADVLAEYA